MSSTAENSKLDAIIAAYVEATERGERPDREQLMAAHPEHAVDLAKFFADYDRMQATHLQQGAALDATAIPQHEPRPDSFIGGRYKLLQNIGEGGMGSVWVAEQKEPVKRKVAIKLVKAGMDSKQVLARFEAERQALAVMDHPNIAKVFDGGMTEHGRPYFVMEYVKGVPFTEYCDKARLSLKERLNLFIPVCQAVQHAHHKGIVHRDLKPSNILICLYDGKPVPKVIDFGLAKAMNQSLTEHSIFTGHGVMVGTPLYMSPEQAEHNNLDVDTRTDIYSLGVVLYELLTGTTPLEREQLRTAAYNEVLRLIKEVEPPRPSTRLSGSNSLPSIAAQRSIDPKHLQKSLSGDLDWIVMKSLEKERSRRYETANGLARDVERFLNDEAVEACPPSTIYRLRKFVRKHRSQVVAISMIVASMVAGIAATSWQAIIVRERSVQLYEANQALEKRNQESRRALESVLLEIVNEPGSSSELSHTFRNSDDSLRGVVFAKTVQPREGSPHVELVEWGPEEQPADNGLIVEFLSEISRTRIQQLRETSSEALNTLKKALNSNTSRLLRVDEESTASRLPDGNYILVPTRTSGNSVDDSIRFIDTNGMELSEPLVNSIARFKQESVDTLDAIKYLGQIVEVSNSGLQKEVDNSIRLLAKVERSLADGILRPIGYGDIPNSAELRAFVDWSQIPDQRLKLRILEIAFEDPDTALRVARRAQRAMQACVGLSPTRRAKAIELVSAKQRDPKADPSIRTAAAWLALEIGLRDLPALPEGLAFLAARSTSSVGRTQFSEFANMIPDHIQQLGPELAVEVGDVLAFVLESTTDPRSFYMASNGLVALAPKLQKHQLQRCWDAVFAAFCRNDIGWFDDTTPIRDALNSFALHCGSDHTAKAWESLIETLHASTIEGGGIQCYADVFIAALAPTLRTEQGQRGFDSLVHVLEECNDPYVVRAVGLGLASLFKSSAKHSSSNVDAFIRIIEKPKNQAALEAACNSLAALAQELSEEQTQRSWDALIEALQTTANWETLPSVGRGLIALAPNISVEQTPQTIIELIRVLETTTDKYRLRAACDGLVALIPRLSPTQASDVSDSLIDILDTATDGDVLMAAGNAFVALAPKMNSKQISLTLDASIDILEKNTDSTAQCSASKSLVVFAASSSPDQTDRSWDALINIATTATYSNPLYAAGDSLVALSPLAGPEQFTRCFDSLVGMMEEGTNYNRMLSAGKVLVVFAPKLNAQQTIKARDALIELLEDSIDANTVIAAGNGLVALAPQLSSDFRVKAGDLIVDSLSRIQGGRSAELGFALIPQLEQPTRDRISLETLLILLDYLALSDEYFPVYSDGVGSAAAPLDALRPAIMTMENKRSLSVLLQHPACIGKPREWMLQRFEELVFHDGNRVFLNFPKEDGDGQANGENPPSAIPDEATLPRRFHTIQDAAAWIQQNWPDFDLEATHPVTWYGER